MCMPACGQVCVLAFAYTHACVRAYALSFMRVCVCASARVCVCVSISSLSYCIILSILTWPLFLIMFFSSFFRSQPLGYYYDNFKLSLLAPAEMEDDEFATLRAMNLSPMVCMCVRICIYFLLFFSSFWCCERKGFCFLFSRYSYCLRFFCILCYLWNCFPQ